MATSRDFSELSDDLARVKESLGNLSIDFETLKKKSESPPLNQSASMIVNYDENETGTSIGKMARLSADSNNKTSSHFGAAIDSILDSPSPGTSERILLKRDVILESTPIKDVPSDTAERIKKSMASLDLLSDSFSPSARMKTVGSSSDMSLEQTPIRTAVSFKTSYKNRYFHAKRTADNLKSTCPAKVTYSNNNNKDDKIISWKTIGAISVGGFLTGYYFTKSMF